MCHLSTYNDVVWYNECLGIDKGKSKTQGRNNRALFMQDYRRKSYTHVPAWTFIYLTFNYYLTGARWSCGGASSGRGDLGSKPPVVERRTFQLKGPEFKTICCRFKTWAISFTHFVRVFRKRLKAVGPFNLGSKISHTGGKCVTCRRLKEWWSLSLTHRFPARERRPAGREPSSWQEEKTLFSGFVSVAYVQCYFARNTFVYAFFVVFLNNVLKHRMFRSLCKTLFVLMMSSIGVNTK